MRSLTAGEKQQMPSVTYSRAEKLYIIHQTTVTACGNDVGAAKINHLPEKLINFNKHEHKLSP